MCVCHPYREASLPLMCDHKKPTPSIVEASSRTCPVCGKRSYSRGGIHPQCAVHMADVPRMERLCAEKKSKIKESQPRAWSKTCPQCRAELHVRQKRCECGHDFAAERRP